MDVLANYITKVEMKTIESNKRRIRDQEERLGKVVY